MALRVTLTLLALLVCHGCGDDDGDSVCGSICDCVASAGGDRERCSTECAEAQASDDPVGECNRRLDLFGFAQCKSGCDDAAE